LMADIFSTELSLVPLSVCCQLDTFRGPHFRSNVWLTLQNHVAGIALP